jgi:galactoside O-acetyltransferase
VVLAAGNDDYISGIGSPTIPFEFKGNVTYGKIHLSELTIVGSNSVILPNVTLGEGSALGALSLANSDIQRWWLYAGIPAKKIKKRKKNYILKQKKEFLSTIR